MNLSSTPIIPLQSTILNVKTISQNHPQSKTLSKQINSNQDSMEINSTLSTNKRQKVPESMKNFLKQRKLVRQIQEPTPPINPNIFQSRKHLFDSSSFAINQAQVANQYTLDQFFHSNQSQIHMERSKKVYQRPASRKSSIHSIICPICEGQLTDKNTIKAFTCRHLFCEECAKSYTKFKINMFEQVTCPQESCASVLNTESDFYKSLSRRQRRIYKKINNFYITQGDASKKMCPKQDCEGVITVDESASVQQCPECRMRFCGSCFLEVHEGKCRDYEVKFMEDTLHYRQCVKCHIVVEKVQGCNHITCKCGYEFCYVCGAKWKHEHICNPEDLEDDGCDWGQNSHDHFIFLIKLPLKFILTSIYSAFWFSISFAAAPYNIFFFMYWILLIFVGGAGQYIFEQEDRPYWQIILLFLIFPLLMVYCVPIGIRLFLAKFQEQCPFISEGYRFIIRI